MIKAIKNKKYRVLSIIMLTIMFYSNNSLANQTIVTPDNLTCTTTECSNLGYTNSKGDCSSGNYLTCPFDENAVYCGACDSNYKYYCSGVGEIPSDSTNECDGLYYSCICSDDYVFQCDNNFEAIAGDPCTADGSNKYSDCQCNESEGYYSTTNDLFSYLIYYGTYTNNSIECNYITGCSATASGDEPDISFFEIESASDKFYPSTCYRATGCVSDATTNKPNELFFEIVSATTETYSTCYRGDNCAEELGAYTSSPNISFFSVTSSIYGDSTCYRGDECNEELGAYSSSPSISFFSVTSSDYGDNTCYRGDECNEAEGATSDKDFYAKILESSIYNGLECFIGTNCIAEDGYYDDEPDDNYSYAQNDDCYYAVGCKVEYYKSDENIIINGICYGITSYWNTNLTNDNN